MKTKYLLSIVVISLTLSQSLVLETSASIKPIITTDLPDNLTIGVNGQDLKWFIIDDNVKNYSISVNNSSWKHGLMESNFIDVQFSYAVGFYDLRLVVYDYSNNYAESFLNITVLPSTQVSTVTGSGMVSTVVSTQTTGTPGFTTMELIFSLGVLVLAIYIKKLKRRKKSL